MTDKALVVLSGGQDSTTCLYWAKAQGWEVHAITFDYGQRHQREIDSAQTIGARAEVVSHETVILGPRILKSTSPLVSDSKLEQYKDHQSLPGGIEKTFVPTRNQLFLTVAANRAVDIGAKFLVTGVAQEDFAGYHDCREVFIRSLEHTTNLGIYGESTTEFGRPIEGVPRLHIMTPLMNLTKKQTVELATQLEGCYAALAHSHTAYDGVYPPTGKDHASLLRAKGFEEAGIPDPLVLRAYLEDEMELPKAPNYTTALVMKYERIAGMVK